MSKKLISILSLFVCIIVNAQDKKETQKTQIVETACGQCQFGMQGKSGCDLAVRLDNKSYFVDGTDIHKYGDAHEKNGLCNAIRKAEVVGEIKNDRFVVSEFKLLPVDSHDSHDNHEGHKH